MNLYSSHNLEAWGWRLGDNKDTFGKETDWKEWSEEMEIYCVQDVRLTRKLCQHLLSKDYSLECLHLEHQFKKYITLQEQNGVGFDLEKAQELSAELSQDKHDLSQELIEIFPKRREVMKSHVWKISRLPLPLTGDYVTYDTKKEAIEYCRENKLPTTRIIKGPKKVRYHDINPTSRDQIAEALMTKYNWKPKELTETGKPKVSESTLAELPYPEAKMFKDLLLINKLLGQLSNGDQGWIRHVNRDSIIKGRVITNGAVTGRCTHSHPNMAQVPAIRVDKEGNILKGRKGHYGYEMRSLFRPTREDWVMVGADASGLELRCLAHYLARWDDGEYAKQILEGDIHTFNQKAAGLPTRNNAKTFIYAWLYGAGDEKIGSIVGGNSKEGKQLKKKFMESIPAVAKLKQAVEECCDRRGYLIGLDGRHLPIRSKHSALNMLLQSAGAVIMKRALVEFMESYLKYIQHFASEAQHRDDVRLMLNVHDEVQIECVTNEAERCGKSFVQAIKTAGEHFNFKCPLDGDFKIGSNWAETH